MRPLGLSEVYNADLVDDCDWQRMLKGVDIIVHAAAEIRNENMMTLVNLDGSLRLLNAAIDAGVKRWVQISSVGAYGPIYRGFVDEQWRDCPVGLYEKTKSDFDLALLERSKHTNLEACIIRPSNVYGTDMRNESIRQMLSAIRKGLFSFIGSKGASANYVHAEDVVQAIELCLHHPKAANQTYIISAWATIEEMVGGLALGAGLNYPSRRIPIYLAIMLANAMKWHPRWPLSVSRVQALSSRARYSTKKIENDLGGKLQCQSVRVCPFC